MLNWLKQRRVAGPRFSDALHEQGRYRVDYGDWLPLTLPGDPVMVEDMPRRQALTVSDQLITIASDRASTAQQFLTTHGLTPRPTPQDWQQVENLLASLAEASAEPEKTTGLRPRFWAFLHDLGFLYAQSLCATMPGARLVRTGMGVSDQAGYLSPLPVIARPDNPFPVQPLHTALAAGSLALMEGRGNMLADGFRMMGLTPARLSHQDILNWHAGFTATEGRRPTADEIAAFMVDHDLTDADLPDTLR